MPQFVHPRTSRRDRGKGNWEQELRRRFWALKPDVVHAVTWLPGACRNCGHPGVEFQMIRCGFCAELAFPRLTLFCGCPACGGASQATLLWALHTGDAHQQVAKVSVGFEDQGGKFQRSS